MNELAFEHALSLIKRRGVLRTPQIAAELGLADEAVDAMLEPGVRVGRLITCDVHTGGRKVIEYRLSMAAGGKEVLYVSAGRPGRAPDPVIERLREWGTPPQPKSAVMRQVPQAARPGRSAASAIKAPAAPAQVDGAPPPSVRKRLEERAARMSEPKAPAAPAAIVAAPKPPQERVAKQPSLKTKLILDAFQQRGPSTPRELQDAGLRVLSLSTLCRAMALRGRLSLLSESPKCRIYGLPHHTLADRKVSAGSEPPGPIERGVPIPPRRYRPNRREYVDALKELQPGECRRIPLSTYDVASICADAGLRGKFVMRTVPEGGVRIWRTKP